MASITLDIAYTYEKVPVYDLDLESVSNTELIEAAWEEGVLSEAEQIFIDIFGESSKGWWKLIGKNNAPVMGEATLASMGFVDGDTIRLIAKLVC